MITGSKLNFHEPNVLNPKLSLTITSRDILLYSRALAFVGWLQTKPLEGSTLHMYLDRKLCEWCSQSIYYFNLDKKSYFSLTEAHVISFKRSKMNLHAWEKQTCG